MAKTSDPLREHLLDLLRGGNAHAKFEDAVRNFPEGLRGKQPDGLPYSAWQLLEHIRIAQDDIVRFSMNYDSKYESPVWPDGYWPKSPTPPSSSAWVKSVEQVLDDRKTFEKLIVDPNQDLYKPFPWGDGQTLLREALLIADHGAYHVGELIAVRRLLGCWPSQ